jgi:RecJ-like exonuclease
MMKVRILDQCEFCDGEAYFFVCEDVDANGQTFDRYRPCEMCHGSGNRAKWLGLREFADKLENVFTTEIDFQEFIQCVAHHGY